MIQMELSRIIICDTSDQQVIVLKEKDGSRNFPIRIGTFEASAIDRGVKELRTSRPLTHDLISNLLDALGVELERVIVSDLRRGTFYAKLLLRRDGEIFEVDSRPSDAIALAVVRNTPIFVVAKVLTDVLKSDSLE
jgi:uncharacterized protein